MAGAMERRCWIPSLEALIFDIAHHPVLAMYLTGHIVESSLVSSGLPQEFPGNAGGPMFVLFGAGTLNPPLPLVLTCVNVPLLK